MRHLVGVLIYFALVLVATADAARHGLMWNATGLPAVFPLQIKTTIGTDTRVTLVDADTGTPALAAYVEGGRFFRVLVPPGRFRLEFDQGETWQGETELFGATGTTSFALDHVLTFEVRGVGVKAGHIVDLTDPEAGIVVLDRFDCHGYRVKRPVRLQPEFDARTIPKVRLQNRDALDGLQPPRVAPRPNAAFSRPTVPTDFAPYLAGPEFEIRATLC